MCCPVTTPPASHLPWQPTLPIQALTLNPHPLPHPPLTPTGYASTVFKAQCKRSGETVVLKIYTLAAVCDLYKYQIYREVRVHASLQHENIVHLYAAFQEGDRVIMVQV